MEEATKAPPEQYYGTGRRKRSVARVYLRPGKGDFVVNGRSLDAYFISERQRTAAPESASWRWRLPERFDVLVTVQGGGLIGTGRSGASGNFPGLAALQHGTAGQAQEAGLPEPRLALEGTQEIRAEGRPQTVPVLQALTAGRDWVWFGEKARFGRPPLLAIAMMTAMGANRPRNECGIAGSNGFVKHYIQQRPAGYAASRVEAAELN